MNYNKIFHELRFSSLFSKLIVFVLNESATQLQIVSGPLTALPIKLLPINERFTQVFPFINVVDPETFPLQKGTGYERTLEKVHTDTQFLIKCLRDLQKELHEDHTFKTLLNSVEYDRHCEEYFLFKHLPIEKKKLTNLQSNQSRQQAEKRNLLDKEIFHWDHLSYKAKLNGNHEKLYVQKYCDSKLNEVKLRMDAEQAQGLKVLDQYCQKTDFERESFENLAIFLHVKISQLYENAAKLSLEHDRQQEIILCEIQDARRELTRFEEIKQESELHFKEIKQKTDEYLEFKQKRALEQEKQSIRNTCAIKLQFWWRGIMSKKKTKKGKSKKSNKRKAASKKKK